MSVESKILGSTLFLLFALMLVLYGKRRYLERRSELKQKPYKQTSSAQSGGYEPNYVKNGIGLFVPEDHGWNADEKHHHRVERFYWGITAMLSVILAIGAVASAAFAYWAYDEARQATEQAHRQADIAQSSYEEGTRAVISASTMSWKKGPEKDKDGFVAVNVTNVGNSNTATFVVSEAIATTSQAPSDVFAFDAGQNKLCDFRNYQPGTVSIFKNGSFYTKVKVAKSDINKMLENASIAIIVRGCYFYSAFDKTHFTGFCFVAAQGSSRATPEETPLCAHGNFAR